MAVRITQAVRDWRTLERLINRGSVVFRGNRKVLGGNVFLCGVTDGRRLLHSTVRPWSRPIRAATTAEIIPRVFGRH